MESPEKAVSPEKYLERAIDGNDDFLAELASFNSLEELRDALRDLAFVTKIDGKDTYVLPEVTNTPGSDDADVKVYSYEEITRSLGVFIEDVVTDSEGLEQEVRNWVPHRDIADAVIRIITKNLNDKETT